MDEKTENDALTSDVAYSHGFDAALRPETAVADAATGVDEVDPNAPKDIHQLVYWSFVLLGLGFLLPWNAIIGAVDFLNYLYPGVDIESEVAFTYMLCNLVTMLVNMAVGINQFGSYTKLYFGFGSLFVILLAICFVTDHFLFLFLTAVSGIGDAIVQSTLYGLASSFPPSYTGAVMMGNGVAGIVVAFLRVITKISFPHDESGLQTSSYIYFFISAFITLLCLGAIFYFQRSPFVTYFHYTRKQQQHEAAERQDQIYQQQQKHLQGGQDEHPRTESSSSETGRYVSPLAHVAMPSSPAIHAHGGREGSGSNADYSGAVETTRSNLMVVPTTPSGGRRRRSSASSRGYGLLDAQINGGVGPNDNVVELLPAGRSSHSLIGRGGHRSWRQTVSFYSNLMWRLRHYLGSIIIIFFVTLAVFPGLSSQLNSHYGLGDWFPVIIFILFDVGDFIGRSLPRWERLILFRSATAILWASICRLVFIPLFCLLWIEQRNGGAATSESPFANDVMSYVVMTAMAISNGYVATLTMMFSSDVAQSEDEKEIIGTLMALNLVCGLTLGSIGGLIASKVF